MSPRFTWSVFFLLAIFVLALAARPSVRRSASGGCCRTAAALPATALGSVSFSGGAVNVVLNQDTAYACGPNAIGIVDISSPQSPNLLGTFGSSDFNGNAISGCFQIGQSLVIPVNVQNGFVYDISNRRNLRSTVQFTPAFPFSGYVSFLGNTGWFTTDSFTYDIGSRAIQTQSGAFFAVDFSTPNSPTAVGNLSPNSSQPASANNSPRFGSLTIGGDTAYVLSTTSSGGDTNGGQAAFQIINIGNPSSPVALGQIIVPQATILTGISAPQNNIVLVTGNTKSWRNPGTNARNPQPLNFQFTGSLTLSAFDVSDPHNPVMVSTNCTGITASFGYSATPLGGGFFVVAVGPPPDDAIPFGADPRGQLLLVDARDPSNMNMYSLAYVAGLSRASVNGSYIYAATSTGLSVFQIPDLSGL